MLELLRRKYRERFRAHGRCYRLDRRALARPFESREIGEPDVVAACEMRIEECGEIATRPMQVATARGKPLAIVMRELTEIVVAHAPAQDGKGALERASKVAAHIAAVDREPLRRSHRAFRRRVLQRRGKGALQLT